MGKKTSMKRGAIEILRENRKRAFRGGVLEDQTIVDVDEEVYQSTLQPLKKPSLEVDTEDVSKKTEIDPHAVEPVPLPEWESLIVVPPYILKPLSEAGFKSPTQIQKECIPAAIQERKDIIGAAETGSGKTLAFGIPLIVNIVQYITKHKFSMKDRPWLSLILTPTRELAVQIEKHIRILCKYTPLKLGVIVGGLNADKQIRILKKRPHILVATPGRLWQLIDDKEAGLETLGEVKWLVIDEADRMVEKGHFMELKKINEYINRPKATEENFRRQTFVFSATLTFIYYNPGWGKKGKQTNVDGSLKDKVLMLMKELNVSRHAKIVDVTLDSGTASKLIESRVLCSPSEKDVILYYLLLKYPGKTLVFANSINIIKKLSEYFRKLGFPVLPLHATMHQKQRLKNVDKFTDNENVVLFATDVAARGLDIPNIKHIVHYQAPRTTENYIHRSGRTARMCKDGISIMLISHKDEDAKNYWKIATNLAWKSDLPIFPIPEQGLLEPLRERVQLVKDIFDLRNQLDREAKLVTMKKNTRGDSLQSDASDYEDTDDEGDGGKKVKQTKSTKGVNVTITPQEKQHWNKVEKKMEGRLKFLQESCKDEIERVLLAVSRDRAIDAAATQLTVAKKERHRGKVDDGYYKSSASLAAVQDLETYGTPGDVFRKTAKSRRLVKLAKAQKNAENLKNKKRGKREAKRNRKAQKKKTY